MMLLDLDGDGVFLGLLGFWHPHLQHAILKRRLYLIGLYLAGQPHRPGKGAEGSFATIVIILFDLFFPFLLSLGTTAQTPPVG